MLNSTPKPNSEASPILFNPKQKVVIGLAVGTTVLAGLLTYRQANSVLVFAVAAVALAMLAATVGEATDQLGTHLSVGATGLLQSAIGNLPELFVCIFALRAGLVLVVQASIIGSILANALLVLGLAFIFGGRRNGTLHFESAPPRMIATLTVLACAALAIPTLAYELHLPAGGHEDRLSLVVALVLLGVFLASIPMTIKGGPQALAAGARTPDHGWPMTVILGVLVASGLGAALVSDWFVEALRPAMQALHISEIFAGLVVVGIAGNAVENVVGIRLALENKTDLALSVILNSSLQVALLLTPVLVLISAFVSGTVFTLVMPVMLVVVVSLAALLGAIVVFDGEANWLEGVALIGLYCIVAAAFWWG